MKKNGFTLVELLAVIIILAVIALIATPIVLDVVDSAKKSAAENSAYGFAKAAGYHWLQNEYETLGETSLTSAKVEDIEVEGERPTNCTEVTFDSKGLVSFTGCTFSGYTFNYSNSKAELVED